MRTITLLQFLPLVPAVLADTVQYPEIVPGPGLPSLASLGLTSEQLYKMESVSPSKVNKRASFAPNYVPFCESDQRAHTHVDGLRMCYTYLSYIGARDCTVPSGFRKALYCNAGDAHINGLSINGRSQTSSCASVAGALGWILDNCKLPNNQIAGSQAVSGNADIIVTGMSSSFSC
ncbi:hypothetical protein HC256_001067 [Beauveria bassiana]|uniref:Secreted protein n=1 Tax=Beauveria bassiana (strain ARSEF 2860) TaxID=655819 RepID=J4UTE5_BEAB2|nr:uncharacterized protein BBA_02122 [Beauveria bassiana ARSEF 2860]EJP69087.1 hypothetical protein BBA_02122 [Beauveria bassiana ARSEF 2860]KAH8720681.1 hypothetical protein HC256_001067 [Beauveria bassiana]